MYEDGSWIMLDVTDNFDLNIVNILTPNEDDLIFILVIMLSTHKIITKM